MFDQVEESNRYFECQALELSMEKAITRVAEMQEIRFSAVVKNLGLARPPASMMDLGCGTGNFLKFLEDRGLKPEKYVGYDSWPAAIAAAEGRWKHDQGSVTFLNCPIQSLFSDKPAPVEYVVSLAVFSHRSTTLSKMQSLLMDTVDLAYKACTVGCAVTALSTYKTNALEIEALFDPLWLWQLGRKLSERVLIDHSYAPETMLVLFKEKSPFWRLWEKKGGWS